MRFARERIYVGPTRASMGHQAAQQIAQELRHRLQTQQSARVIFAAAPSQSEMLQALLTEPEIAWQRVEAFHMDEYIGLPADAAQSFRAWLRNEIFDRVPFGAVHLIEPGSDPEACAARYADLLRERPVDIVCLGIGINGHIAFNDPPAHFDDPADVRIVKLQQASRQQQVDDGLFETVQQVPTHAITLTIPRLLRAERLFCSVPGSSKRTAVTRAFTGTIDPSCPATILRVHPHCNVYLDQDSAAGINL